MLENAPLLLFFCLVGLLAIAMVVAVGAVFGKLAAGLTRRALRRRSDADALAKTVKRLAQVCFAMFVVYSGYTAVYPADDFYLGEFWLATDRAPPTESVVVAKDSTYWTFTETIVPSQESN